MASPHVYDEIKGALQMQFAPIPVLDWDQLEPAIEQQQNPFLVLQEMFSDEPLVAFGDPNALCYRESATVQILVYVPAPEASAAGRSLAEQVQSYLRARLINGVRVIDVSSPEPSDLNDGLWSVVGVTADVEMDRYVARP